MGLNEKMTELADTIRGITGGTDKLTIDGMIRDVKAIGTAGITNTAEGSLIKLLDSDYRYLRGLNLYGKTIQNGTPTPEEPVPLESVGDDGAVTVTVGGKNLFNKDDAKFVSGISFGIDVFNGADDVVRVYYIAASPNTTYTYSKKLGSYTRVGACPNIPAINAPITTRNTDTSGSSCTIRTGPNDKYIAFYPLLTSELETLTYEDVVATVQIELGNTATEYEPYSSTSSVTAQTPNGLPGIPVSSGGNYTDENGQQWICDEIDFARGKYVRRLGDIASYSGEPISGQYMSTTGALTTGARVLYVLDSYIETDLTVEEIAQYSALHTNYPQTLIYNDDNAWMAVKYAADLKLYIDNKTAALAAAILNS